MKTKKEVKQILCEYYIKQVEIELIFENNKKNNISNSTKLLIEGIEINTSISVLERVLN